MSDAPERILLELRQGMADDFWSECRDPRYAKSEPVAYVRADRIEKLEALLRAALTIYAQSGNWRLGGCCDPNSPNFTGEAIARAALKVYNDE